ncbi:TIGR03086 family metal-binding protein [Streptomyces hainanensis]|uniref:TIGR03086 family protein n=1 Tax=Streptomyces hainanensis TaxID=402648 RepID=A0A4R4TFI0_9ACTN|nr:TIGR03086 family metal-binding protein [Streptomyces hainanensis]TDC76207.1 TIGR03086 family protein [Streptomyces hainanensis]
MTTHDIPLDLGPAARGVAGLLDGVGDERFAAATPCPDYRVEDLLRHLLGLTLAFRAAARKEFGPLTDLSPTDPAAPVLSLDGDWRGRLRGQLDELAAAWGEPAAWAGETRAGGVTLPAAVLGRVALNELLLHGWDLARATGQPYPADEASARAAIALLSAQTEDAAREGTGFGPVVPVPDDASSLDRAIGLGGRDPSWTPPA